MKNRAEGRAIHLNELLGKVHEEKIKNKSGDSAKGLPPMPEPSSQKRRTLRQSSPGGERVTYDLMKSNSKDGEMACEDTGDISVLTSPTMSHPGYTPPQPATGDIGAPCR